MRHMGRPSLTREESAQALERYEGHWREHGFGVLAAEEKATGSLVGRVGPAYHAAWAHEPETGWAFDPCRWGRGLATEAGAECVRWALEDLGFRRVVSICTEENLASRRVMAKLGFRLLTRTLDERFGLELLVHAFDAD
jgi:RimJ/RimL family protein N-acetyltransferase